jgi:competence ComEA-like helix-hairpin-helix protein
MELDRTRNAVVIALLAVALIVAVTSSLVGTARRPRALEPAQWSCDGPHGPSLTLFCTGRLPVNEASERDLTRLRHIGPARARAIVEHRRRHGPFSEPSDLEAVRGLGPVTVERLAPALVFSHDGP